MYIRSAAVSSRPPADHTRTHGLVEDIRQAMKASRSFDLPAGLVK